MCTIIALYRVRSDYPLLLATNRDEFYTRPAAGVGRLLEQPVTVGGRDLSAMGTWMGVTAQGFFVGVTNQRTLAAPRRDVRSRGELVMRMLQAGSPDDARRLLEAERPNDYNDFNLMFGNAESMWVAYGRERASQVHIEPLPPGVHVLPNGILNSDQFPKCQRARDLLVPHAQAPFPQLVDTLKSTLADGQLAQEVEVPDGAAEFFSAEILRKLTALCVRTEYYGTRSSAIVALRPGRCVHYLTSDGAPDQAPFMDAMHHFRGSST